LFLKISRCSERSDSLAQRVVQMFFTTYQKGIFCPRNTRITRKEETNHLDFGVKRKKENGFSFYALHQNLFLFHRKAVFNSQVCF